MEQAVDIPRAVLIEAVATATEHAGLTGEPARKLRDFARYTKTLGSNFSTGCPMTRCDLYGYGSYHGGVTEQQGDGWVCCYDDYILAALPDGKAVAFIRGGYARVIG